MEIKYFDDTDTLLVTLTHNEVTETKDLSEDVIIDVDKNGNLVSMTIEHAKDKAEIQNFSFQKIEKEAIVTS